MACVVFLFVAETGYPMQPPPPPLTLPQLRRLTSEADLIVVGKIGRIGESGYVNGGEAKKEVAVTLSVEKLLKGRVSDKIITIKEIYTSFDSPTPGLTSRDKGEPPKAIIGLRAGPSRYHGRYRQGDRIIVLLANIEGTAECRPLGSGTYDKHLCEFLIEDEGIKTFYFTFATDLVQYAETEEKFTGLIRT
ncbi:MAG: hypothetical protein PHY29_12165, partial [Syntrophales bacterium]|nr:hypothetical protein [Syntrophales bacterium]